MAEERITTTKKQCQICGKFFAGLQKETTFICFYCLERLSKVTNK